MGTPSSYESHHRFTGGIDAWGYQLQRASHDGETPFSQFPETDRKRVSEHKPSKSFRPSDVSSVVLDLRSGKGLTDDVGSTGPSRSVFLSHELWADELSQRVWSVLGALARAVDASSPWTADHSERVAQLACEMGAVMGFPQEKLETLCRAAQLHDIGKIGIDPAIVDKPGRLSKEESRQMEEHPRIGAHILEPVGHYADIVPAVLQHHERFNGQGYPNGVAGNEICLEGRILAVADVYDALVSERPYQVCRPQEQAVGFIQDKQGKHFDPIVVEAFSEVMAQKAMLM